MRCPVEKALSGSRSGGAVNPTSRYLRVATFVAAALIVAGM
jgi:hypothetical protein